MNDIKPRQLHTLSALILILSLFACVYNLIVTQYHGNRYFPPNYFLMLPQLALMRLGCGFIWGQDHYTNKVLTELLFLYAVYTMILIATNAVQYTPFPAIDQHILNFELSLGISLDAMMAWAHQFPLLIWLLTYCYASLVFQMNYLPVVLILFRQTALVREYCFFLLLTCLIGFTVYYFFPTKAPASVIDNYYFTEANLATGIKFDEIHQHLKPSTMNGGLISLPSFHVIWAWYCLYLIRFWTIGWTMLLMINMGLVISCVCLGWHYPIDLVLSGLIIFFCHQVRKRASFFNLGRPLRVLGAAR